MQVSKGFNIMRMKSVIVCAGWGQKARKNCEGTGLACPSPAHPCTCSHCSPAGCRIETQPLQTIYSTQHTHPNNMQNQEAQQLYPKSYVHAPNTRTTHTIHAHVHTQHLPHPPSDHPACGSAPGRTAREQSTAGSHTPTTRAKPNTTQCSTQTLLAPTCTKYNGA